MPFGYYQFIRYIAVVDFAILACYEYERKNIPVVIVFVALAILFLPLAIINLGKFIWNIVEVIIAIGLLVQSLYGKR
jgi:hypothetical protein